MIVSRYKVLFFIMAILPLHVQGQKLVAEKSEEGILVKEAGEKVLFYQVKTKAQEGEYARANYIHPLYGLDGNVLTEDFPVDHLHHRGVFWAWHQIEIDDQRIGDGWACENFISDVQSIESKASGEDMLMLNAHGFWKSPLWLDDQGNEKPFLSENTLITIHPRTEHFRSVDFEISLLALVPNLKIGGSEDEKGYSGFSVRIKLPEDIQFISQEGIVTPITNQVSAGPWMNMSGSLGEDGTPAGVVLICHPENPTYPEPWILRAKNSMQNAVYPGRELVDISEDYPTVLRYRLVIYDGTLSEREIRKIEKSYK